jgi:hypothetical protein
VVIQPFDRLTALSEVERLDAHVASLLGMTFVGFIGSLAMTAAPSRDIQEFAGNPNFAL